MLFNSLDYFAFLGLTLAGFWAIRFLGPERDDGPRTRGAWLRLLFVFLASCAFYMAWNWRYIGLILFSTLLDYCAGLGIHAAKSSRAKKAWLGLSLAGNLGLLGVFKYFNFFSEATGDVLSLFGVAIHAPVLDVLLPVGISFYTFQTLSYTIDVYRGRLEPVRNPIEFAFYVTFFAQLVAGPIVRASELLPQLRRPPWLDRERVGHGLFLIAIGLIKKVILADFVSVNLVDRVFADPSAFSGTETIIGLYAFTLQIYADFSGYTDVARGSSLLFGIELPENFDRPYQATSVAEFWRRWHMTLSTWLRDYLYFPLGGSKSGELRTYFNLYLTLFLIGLWHGASWTFVIYGNLQAAAVMWNRYLVRERAARRGPTRPSSVYLLASAWNRLNDLLRGGLDRDPLWLTAVKVLLTMQFVVFSRILFRATGLDNAELVASRVVSGTWSVAQVSTELWGVLLAGFVLHYLPRSWLESLRSRFVQLPPWAQGIALALVGVVLAIFVTAEAVPYIYFQF
ncbi:MAG: MBOAT family protein [Sandaracinaceae bacterium]|nr:MBOAT family protein [Sandaracinaceae bacterium]